MSIESSSNVAILERWTQIYNTSNGRCLFLENLDTSIDPQNLLDTFSRFGKIQVAEIATSIETKRDETMFGFAPFLEYLSSSNMELHPVENDGNCLFRACSLVLHGTESKHMELRHEVANEMERTWAEIQMFIEMPVQKYIAKVRCSGYWAGQLELSLIQKMYNHDVIILDADLVGNERRVEIGASCSKDDEEEVTSKQNERRKMIHLSYHGGRHYNAILPEKENGGEDGGPVSIRSGTHGLCLFSDQSSVTKILKLSPIHILQRQIILSCTPENTPVVGDLFTCVSRCFNFVYFVDGPLFLLLPTPI